MSSARCSKAGKQVGSEEKECVYVMLIYGFHVRAKDQMIQNMLVRVDVLPAPSTLPILRTTARLLSRAMHLLSSDNL